MPLRAPARRRLLAALLVRAGRTVPVDVLVDDLWGPVAPRTAAKTLQSHVMRLRADLGPELGTAVCTDSTGYRLAAEPDDVDALRFERLLLLADSTPDQVPGRRLQSLDEALALWRDDPYLDLPDAAFLVAERQRLTELRALAREKRTGTALACGQAAELVAELEARVRAEPYRERSWEQLALALYRSGRQADALAALRRVRSLLSAELAVDPGPQLQDFERQVLTQDPALLAAASVPPEVRGPQRCPYQGLSAFDVRDAALFVGRERLTARVLARLAEDPVVVLTGASGSGKSSLVRAGLVAGLQRGALPGSASWRVAVLTPLSPPPEPDLDLLVLDQAEELFTRCTDPERQRWAGLVAGRAALGLVTLVVVRAEFYARLAEAGDLGERAALATVLVPPMRRDELRRAVVEPAQRCGLTFQDDFVDVVLDELAGAVEALPLLSTALRRAWANRTGSVLTIDGYRRGGGVAGAIEANAEEAYDRLGPAERGAARRLLVRLAARSSGGWVRRRMTAAEMSADADPAVGPATTVLADARLVTVDAEGVQLTHEALLDRWPRLQRWLAQRERQAELLDHLRAAAHSWDAAGRPASDLYRASRLAAGAEWAETHPADLTTVEREFLEASLAADRVELVAARERAEREAAGRRRLRRITVAVAVVAILAVVGGVVAGAERISARHAAARAQQEALAADSGRLAAQSLVAPDLADAGLLAAAAFRLQDSPDSRGALLSTMTRGAGALFRIPTSQRLLNLHAAPDGTRLFAMDNRRTVYVVDPARRRIVTTFPLRATFLSGVTTDGNVVVAGWANGNDNAGAGRVSVLDGRTGRTVRVLTTDASETSPPVVTEDGRWLAIAATVDPEADRPGSRTVDLYDLARPGAPKHTVRFGSDVLALAAGGSTIAVATSGRRLSVVDAATGRTRHRGTLAALPGSAGAAGDSFLELSPDDQRGAVAAAGDLTSLEVARTAGLSAPPVRISLSTAVSDVAYSPDGGIITAGASDGSITLFGAGDGHPTAALPGHHGPVLGLAFGPGGRLYSAALDRQIVAWSLGAGAAAPMRRSGPAVPTADHAETFGGSWVVGNYPQQDGTNATAQRLFVLDARSGRERSWSLGLSPGSWVNQTVADADGSLALVSVQDAAAHCSFQLWNLRTGTRITEIRGPVDPAGSDAALSPDGRRAVISVDQTLMSEIAIPSGRRLAQFSVRFARPAASRLYAIPWYFTPDGAVLVAAYDPGPPPPGPPDGPAELSSPAQAPENQRFGLLDLHTHRLTAQVGLGPDPMTAVAWSPDGRRLAVGTTQGELRLYDARTLQVLQDAGAAHAGYVRSVSFSSDGTTLASAGTDGALRLWSGQTLAPEGGRIVIHSDSGSTWWYAFFLPSGDLAGFAPASSGPDGAGRER